MAEKFTGTGGAVRWTNYLVAAGGLVGMHVENSDETVATRYFHKDHLGSISVITDENGLVLERLSYDAWGKRRFPNGVDDPAGIIASQTSRGFTGHEELDAVGLVHMNGRVYDPLIARFGTADPTTENPFGSQGWNRYSYVGNSPLNFTDPSGYCFLGCFWKSIFKAVGGFFKENLQAIVRVAASSLSLLCGPAAALCAGVINATIVGLSGGSLSQALRAGFISAFTAAAFFAVGELTGYFPGAPNGGHAALDFGSEAHLFNIAGHALVGCGSAVASRSKCGPGALSAAAGSFAGPMMKSLNSAGQLVATSIVGGVASVAGGGKFANGAITAAFGYLFNAEGGRAVGRAIGGLVGFLMFTAEDGPWAALIGHAWGSAVGGQIGSDLEDKFLAEGPYAHLEDPENIGPGKSFTAEQKARIIEENMLRNGGVVKSDLSGEVLTEPSKSERGVTPDPNEWQIDHRWPKALGGSNSYGNAQVLSRQENRGKWTSFPW
jgi:RHS repeat-associated protein